MWTTIMMMTVCVSFSSLPQSSRSLGTSGPTQTCTLAPPGDCPTSSLVASAAAVPAADEPDDEETPDGDQPPPPPPKREPPEPIIPPVTPPNIGGVGSPPIGTSSRLARVGGAAKTGVGGLAVWRLVAPMSRV
jgi:hypothetical protein